MCRLLFWSLSTPKGNSAGSTGIGGLIYFLLCRLDIDFSNLLPFLFSVSMIGDNDVSRLLFLILPNPETDFVFFSFIFSLCCFFFNNSIIRR